MRWLRTQRRASILRAALEVEDLELDDDLAFQSLPDSFL